MANLDQSRYERATEGANQAWLCVCECCAMVGGKDEVLQPRFKVRSEKWRARWQLTCLSFTGVASLFIFSYAAAAA